MTKRFLLVLAALALASCADMKTWIGHSDVDLMAKNGAPDLQSTASDGSRILTYYYRNGYGQIVCRGTFRVKTNGTIVSYSGC